MRALLKQFRRAPGRIVVSVFALALAVGAIGVLAIPTVSESTLHAAFGVMTALYEKEKSGRGQVIDVSLLTTGITFMLPLLAEKKLTGISREQQGNTSYYTAPGDIYRVKDGWVLLSVIGEPMFRLRTSGARPADR